MNWSTTKLIHSVDIQKSACLPGVHILTPQDRVVCRGRDSAGSKCVPFTTSRRPAFLESSMFYGPTIDRFFQVGAIVPGEVGQHYSKNMMCGLVNGRS
ncbi:unnamed protein product [Somion occarium]|uniref:Uncharacterized protein n=1 Tax=Somion occarium TaxID=3059160 RepID=A0ABP1CKH9_9APHY